MTNAIELSNITKSFDGFAVKDVSLRIKKGFVTGLIGENGAGKSTLIKMIMNLIRPDSGELRVLGMDYKENEKAIKERIGFIYNDASLYEELTLTDTKRIVGHSYKQWSNPLFDRYCDQFELPMNKRIEQFSEGMKVKASLAIALSHHADLLIFDEPTANLDPVFRKEFIEILREVMLDEEKTILLSTHILSDLVDFADYITYIRKGKIIFSKDMHEISEQYCIVRGSIELLDQDTEQLFLTIKKSGNGFEALSDQSDQVKEIFQKLVVIEQASLEDIMYFSREERNNDPLNQEKPEYS